LRHPAAQARLDRLIIPELTNRLLSTTQEVCALLSINASRGKAADAFETLPGV
jgi:hypothetical protein